MICQVQFKINFKLNLIYLQYNLRKTSFSYDCFPEVCEEVKGITDTLNIDYGFMCQYEKGLNFETIWSSVFDLDTLDIYRAEGDPRRKKYISDERLKR